MKKAQKLILALAIIYFGFCGLEQARAQTKPANPPSESHSAAPNANKADGVDGPVLSGDRHPLYRLHHSDEVALSFAFAPEFSQVITVQPDGYVSLRQLPEIYAEGMTLAQFQSAVEQAYGSFLNHPQITVSLKEFEKPYFIATGQVARPGKYELRDDMTVTEALAIAGGFTEKARHSQVVLFRRISGDVSEAKLLNIKEMLKSRVLREDVHLRSGDLLYVPQNMISKLQHYIPTSSMGMYLNSKQF